MDIVGTLANILQTNNIDLLAKAQANTKEYPYFDMAYIAKAIADNKNAAYIYQAAWYTNNNKWLQYLLQNEYIGLQTIVNNNITAAPKVTESTSIETSEIVEKIELLAQKEAPEDVELLPFNLPSLSTKPNTESISFEPFHTVDYFASQGIKPTAAADGTDKLSLQLKSFTAWLKTMKKVDTKLPENDMPTATTADITVVNMAENSLNNNEILTETMADVLVKQGKTNAAITMYEKLSLQDSNKSAYFAEIIKDLKS